MIVPANSHLIQHPSFHEGNKEIFVEDLVPGDMTFVICTVNSIKKIIQAMVISVTIPPRDNDCRDIVLLRSDGVVSYDAPHTCRPVIIIRECGGRR